MRTPSRLRFGLLAGFLISFSMSTAACRQEPATLGIDTRWIDEAPQELFSYDRITRREESDVFESSVGLPGWRTEPPALRPRRAQPALRTQLLRRPVDFDADEVDVLEIEIQPMPRQLTLDWTNETSSVRRGISLRPVDTVDGVFRFMVGTAENWQGRMKRLRLTVTTTRRQPHEIVRTSASRFVLEGPALASALQSPWQVALHGDVRSALLNLPGTTVDKTIEVPPEARLEFSYALPKTANLPVSFQVSAREAGKDESELLFEDRLDPSAAFDVSAWKQASVDLSVFAGRSVTLELGNTADGTYDPLDGIPAWGHPEMLAWATSPRPPNVVLISLDTLRADHLSAYGYERQTSPNIDQWARESGVIFRSAVAAAPWTLPSHLSLFTGVDAMRHGVNHSSPAPSHWTTMAEHLRQAGYTTAAITGSSFLHPKFGLSQGFDFYRSSSVDRAVELADGMSRTLEWLAAHHERRPFFLFFHTYEIHDPYEPRKPWFKRFAAAGTKAKGSVVTTAKPHKERDGLRLQRDFFRRFENRPDEPLPSDQLDVAIDRYDSGIAYVDDELGKFFAALDELGLRDNTMIVLTSDHGESLGEHDLAGHGYLYDDNLLVPLIVSAPGRDWGGRTVDAQVRAIDVLPTVLELTDATAAPAIDGESLLPVIDDEESAASREAFSYSGHHNNGLALRVRNQLKYIFHNTPWRPAKDAEELFVLSEDPGELHNAATTDPRAAPLREQTQAWIESSFSGLRIQIRNSGDAILETRLESSAMNAFTVRTVDTRTTCRWQGPKGVLCRVKAGKSFELLIENIQSAAFTISGTMAFEGESPVPFKAELTVDELSEPQLLPLEGGDLRPADETEAAEATGLTFSWAGERQVYEASPIEADAELQKQLRALGYID